MLWLSLKFLAFSSEVICDIYSLVRRDFPTNLFKTPICDLLVKACMVAGPHPNLVRVDKEGGVMRTQKESKVRIQPGSMTGKTMDLGTDWLVYEEMTRVGRTAYVRGGTPVCPAAVAFFGGPSKMCREGEEGGGNLYLEEPDEGPQTGRVKKSGV